MSMLNRYASFLMLCVLAAENCEAAQPNSTNANIKVCHAIVDAVNHAKLDKFAIPDSGLAKVDVNNDGKPERVEFGQESLEIFDSNGHPIELTQSNENDWESDNLRWVATFSLIEYGKQVYILGKTSEQPHYLARVDGKNVEKVICEFGFRKNPAETLIKSNNDKLCQAVFTQSLDYVKFDRLYALSTENFREAGIDKERSSKLAAYVDINNDGEKDYVVGLGFASSSGGACGGGHLWVLNKARNKQNVAITQQLPEWVCGDVDQAPFMFEGQAYIKTRGANDHSATHQVVQLKHGHLETACQFDVKATYYVLGEYEHILANAKSASVDPWVYALEMPETSGLQVMLEAKHDIRINIRTNTFGTVIHEAIRRNKYDALQLLLENGADPNVEVSDDSTDMPTLIFAIWQNSIEALSLLLKHGANPNQTWNGQSAKDWVNFWGHSATNKALMLELLSKK